MPPGFKVVPRPCLRLNAAVLLAAVAAGCTGDPGIATRTREKSAAYATLTPREKKHIDQGAIALGYTVDMVYMAIGHPSKMRPVEGAAGKGELWTYSNYYPPVDAAHVKRGPYTTESLYQPSSAVIGSPTVIGGQRTPFGGGRSSSLSASNGPQGGPLDLADLKSYTLLVLFEQGKVTWIGLRPS